MAIDVEKSISQLVANQFPDFYKEEGELFIAFVKAYYEWLETAQFTDKDGNTIQNASEITHHSRKLSEYRDIDTTIDDFILSFKNKYLSNIQFNVATNKQLFIKNALEFYRAKGSSRAIDLFFKLVYGLEARVYTPSDDVFRLSDNEWTDERYLELLPDPSNINFVGKQVFGSVSGASAFGEKLIRIKRGSLYIEVLYLSGLNSNFETDELVFALDDVELGGTQYRNRMIGSLSSFQIKASSAGFIVGEEVAVKDGKGKKGVAIVTAVRNAVGVVDFNLVEGGWGYSNDAQVIGSKRTLRFDEIKNFTNEDFFFQTQQFPIFDKVKQDLHRFYLNGSNAISTAAALSLDLGTELYITHNDVVGANVVFTGTLVDKSSADEYLVLNYTKSDYPSYALVDGRYISNTAPDITFLYSNADSSSEKYELEDVIDAIDISVEANVIAVSNVFTIEYTTNYVDSFSGGAVFYQKDDVNQIYARAKVANTFSNNATSQTFINLQSTVGAFRTNRPFYLLDDETDTEFSIVELSNVNIGMIGTTSEELPFKLYANTYVANTSVGTYAPGSANNRTSTFTTQANFTLSTFEEQETQFYYETTTTDGAPLTLNNLDLTIAINNTDSIDAGDPGNSEFQEVAQGNTIYYSNTTLLDALNYTTAGIEIGSIDSIVVTAPGEGYGDDPFFIVYDPLTSHIDRHDYYIRYKDEGDAENLLKTFRVGEKIVVAGEAQTKEARIYDFNIQTREIFARRLNWDVRLADPIDSGNVINFSTESEFRHGETITGQTSGVSVIIETVDETRMLPGPGHNADVTATALSGNGFATAVKIINSGFGYFGKNYVNETDTYEPGENLILQSTTNSDRSISVKGFLGNQGIAPGNHPNRRSFLSADKYLADNDFYQEYSYQVLSALPFTKYKKTLVDVLHVAGSKPFGGYVGTSEAKIDITPTDTSAQFDLKSTSLFINQNTFYTANVA